LADNKKVCAEKVIKIEPEDIEPEEVAVTEIEKFKIEDQTQSQNDDLKYFASENDHEAAPITAENDQYGTLLEFPIKPAYTKLADQVLGKRKLEIRQADDLVEPPKKCIKSDSVAVNRQDQNLGQSGREVLNGDSQKVQVVTRWNGEIWGGGQKDGYGWVDWKNGPTYTGYWKSGYITTGKMVWPCGKKYIGEWQDGMRNGIGRVINVDETGFIGQWKNNKKNGSG
jgi:hypothetical protein